MTVSSPQKYDLEDRTATFADAVRVFIRRIPSTLWNKPDCEQLIRSSGSIAANYIEANESVSNKDCLYRIRICRKEAKETMLWLRLVDTQNNQELETERQRLRQEAKELMLIISSILQKISKK